MSVYTSLQRGNCYALRNRASIHSSLALAAVSTTVVILLVLIMRPACTFPGRAGILLSSKTRTDQLGRPYGSALPPNSSSWPHYVVQPSHTCLDSSRSVFIGILSGGLPNYRERRDAVRETWATWAPDYGFHLKFFVDIPADPQHRALLGQELSTHQDMVLLDPTFQAGPGSIWNRRAAWLIQYALAHGSYTYIVRADDDTFICVQRLRFVLNYMPSTNLFMAHYFSLYKPNHTDVQFVASRDVATRYVRATQLAQVDVPWTAPNMGLPNATDLVVCNEVSMTMGKHPVKGNLPQEGWLVVDELPAEQQARFCASYISNHQSYPSRMRSTFDSVKHWAAQPCPALLNTMTPLRCRTSLYDGS